MYAVQPHSRPMNEMFAIGIPTLWTGAYFDFGGVKN